MYMCLAIWSTAHSTCKRSLNLILLFYWNPWGFKLWVRAGITGILCDFDVNQDSVEGIRAKSELGLSGDVVMKLASTLPKGQNYKIFADNYFTSVPLVAKLLDCGIHYVGTARQVLLPKVGEVDLLDLFATKYKFPMKACRWYIYIFWHTIILAVINAWLLYKRDCETHSIPKNGILNRRHFQAELASSLILMNVAPNKHKRGRPSSSSESPVTSRSPLHAQKRPFSGDGSPPNVIPAKRSSSHSPPDVLKDMIAYFPV